MPQVLTIKERETFENAIRKMTPAQRELYRLLRYADFNEIHEFTFKGSRLEAERFVGNMRTCFTRLRKEAQDANRKIQRFTIKLIEIKTETTEVDEVGNTKKSVVHLMKVKSDSQRMSDGLSLIFDKLKLIPDSVEGN